MVVRRIAAALALVALVLSGAVACTGDDDPQPTTLPPLTSTSASSPPPTTSAPTTSAGPTTENQIESQWKEYFAIILEEQNADANTLTGAFAQVAEPVVIVATRDAMLNQQKDGEKQIGGNKFGDIQVTMTSATTANVRECRDTSDFKVVKASTGEVSNPGWPKSEFTGQFTYSTDKVWRMNEFTLVDHEC